MANAYYRFTTLGGANPTCRPPGQRALGLNCGMGICNMNVGTVAAVNPDTTVGESSVIVPTLANGVTGFAALNAVNSVDVTANLGSSFRARLEQSNLVWAMSAEPALHMGVSTSYPMEAALSADGTELVD